MTDIEKLRDYLNCAGRNDIAELLLYATLDFKDNISYRLANIKAPTISVIKLDKLKQEDLKKYGTLVELSLEDIFGY